MWFNHSILNLITKIGFLSNFLTRCGQVSSAFFHIFYFMFLTCDCKVLKSSLFKFYMLEKVELNGVLFRTINRAIYKLFKHTHFKKLYQNWNQREIIQNTCRIWRYIPLPGRLPRSPVTLSNKLLFTVNLYSCPNYIPVHV